MIEISGKLADYRSCTACRSTDNVREIKFSYDNGAFSQGTIVTLCKKCRKELSDILRGDDNETD